MHRISCFTLFDITKTGIANRARPGDDVLDTSDWFNKRNTQCNFDTILQVISLRAQPDVINDPKKFTNKLDNMFGLAYQDNNLHNIWTFDFTVQHSSVFEDGIQQLGYLYQDCIGVPMIISDNIDIKIVNTLQIDDQYRNIFFVKL